MEFLNEGVNVLDKSELQEAKAGSCGDYSCYFWLDIIIDDICFFVVCRDYID